MNYTILYFGTSAMVFLSGAIIFLVLWASRQFRIQKKYAENRDKFYIKRLDDIEGILKNEISNLINQLKKI